MNEENIENQLNNGKKIVERNPDGTIKSGINNPKGKPKGVKNFTTKIREALEKIAEGKEYTYEEAFVKAILKKAIVDQDPVIMRLIWNYLDGMPAQKFGLDDEVISQITFVLKEKNGNTDNKCIQTESGTIQSEKEPDNNK